MSAVLRLALAALAALAFLVPSASDAAAATTPDHIVVTVSPRLPLAGQETIVRAVAVDAAGARVSGFAGDAKWTDSAGVLGDTAPAAFVAGISRTPVKLAGPARTDVVSVYD